MKAKKNNTPQMKIIRNKIDLIDDKLLPLMVRRSHLVEKALELKVKRAEIVDKKRISEITKSISKKTKKLGGNPKLLSDIWLSIIDNFIKFEKNKFKK
jgi:chorismate mutase|tara:strand:- start:5001 stop:5294 length:294 start_codon:yes stop_codon:yes gene_type:complete